MKDEKKCTVPNSEEIKELGDEQLESVNGGLAVPTIGPVNLSGIKTGTALPEDTGFKPRQNTVPSILGTSGRPKN